MTIANDSSHVSTSTMLRLVAIFVSIFSGAEAYNPTSMVPHFVDHSSVVSVRSLYCSCRQLPSRGNVGTDLHNLNVPKFCVPPESCVNGEPLNMRVYVIARGGLSSSFSSLNSCQSEF